MKNILKILACFGLLVFASYQTLLAWNPMTIGGGSAAGGGCATQTNEDIATSQNWQKSLYDTTNRVHCQTVQAFQSGDLYSISFYVDVADTTQTCTAYIGSNTNCDLSTNLLDSDTVSVASTDDDVYKEVVFATPPSLTNATTYSIGFTCDGTSEATSIDAGYASPSEYANGQYYLCESCGGLDASGGGDATRDWMYKWKICD